MKRPVRIDIRPVWRFHAHGSREFDLTLLELLETIEQGGKLTAAARRAAISYRHAWNLIERWAALFGAPLVTKVRGRGTRLSPLGTKLLWAGRHAQARLAPELENLAAEFANTLNQAMTGDAPTLCVHASHDFALARLRELAHAGDALIVDLSYRGSAQALASLRRGACDLAGFHIAAGPLGTRTAIRYSASLRPRADRIIRMATRTQGLIVMPGNPKGIAEIADLASPGVRLVNRQRDSGTRILLDQLLSDADIGPGEVGGYENEEHTHSAVAVHVASGLADVGLGIEAAAAQFNLGFVPLVTEHYFFAVRGDALSRPAIQAFIALLRSEPFRGIVNGLPGYRAERSGEVAAISDTPPWSELIAAPADGTA